MAAESVEYVAVCDCSDPARDLVYTDDERPIGGQLSLRGVDTMHAVSFAIAPILPNVPIEHTLRGADEVQSEYAATTTFWPDGHLSRTIRCARHVFYTHGVENFWALARK